MVSTHEGVFPENQTVMGIYNTTLQDAKPYPVPHQLVLDAVRAAGNQRNLAFKPHFTHLQRVFNRRGPDNTNCWQGWFMIDYGLAVS